MRVGGPTRVRVNSIYLYDTLTQVIGSSIYRDTCNRDARGRVTADAAHIDEILAREIRYTRAFPLIGIAELARPRQTETREVSPGVYDGSYYEVQIAWSE